MWEAIALLLLQFILPVSPHCTGYGVCNHHQFVPAPPGHTPSCAKPGSTFCEAVDHYPRQLIRYLIEKWGYDYNTLLSDESRDDFNDRRTVHIPQPVYGPPQKPAHGPPPIIQPAYTFGPFNITTQTLEHGGYPDRRYKLEPHYFTNALQQQQEPATAGQYYYNRGTGTPQIQQNLQSFQWWKRYKRSEHTRKKRQSQIGAGALCPTRSSYIMPRAALNTRGNWMYTVNLNDVDNRYTQLVRSETCITNRCSGLCSVPNGYSSRCQQQYVQKRLVALDGNGERLYSDVFWFPHCCVCQIVPN